MVYVVMGVCGCGKSTIGQMLADSLNIPFFDGDNFHPQANVEKMKSGQPLNDDDRKPWLEAMAAEFSKWNSTGGAVLACSALKDIYRKTLQTGGDVTFVYLKGDKETLWSRLSARTSHFMPPALLDSQLATLEEPTDAIIADVKLSPEQMIKQIQQQIEEMN
jgi:carbohydrate kinase (thermoresistant glucokinase family)